MSQTVTTPPPGTPSAHPLLAAAASIEAALVEVADVEPMFMETSDKATALLGITRQVGRLQELQTRIMAASDDVAAAAGMRDPAAWLAHHARLDSVDCRRLQQLAAGLNDAHGLVRDALRDGEVNPVQCEVIVRAIDALPTDTDPEIRDLARAHLVDEAQRFGPRALRILGRRVLQVIAPDVVDEQERRQVEDEEREAARRAFLRSRRNGDGTTDIRARVSDAIAARLLTYLESFSSPRRAHLNPDQADNAEASRAPGEERPHPGPPQPAPDDRRPYDQRLGHAFGAFLEAVDPARLPLHGGAATALMITIDLQALCDEHGLGLLGDEPITAGEARRLACTANILPAVLGGRSEILDMGRTARLYDPAQRRAMAARRRHLPRRRMRDPSSMVRGTSPHPVVSWRTDRPRRRGPAVLLPPPSRPRPPLPARATTRRSDQVRQTALRPTSPQPALRFGAYGRRLGGDGLGPALPQRHPVG